MTAAKKLVFGCLALVFFALPATASAFTIFGWTFDLFGSSLDDGLVGHWTFDGKYMDNNVTDSSGSGNNGMLLGQTSTTTTFGVLGQALSFDGVDDYVNVGSDNSLDLDNNFSIAAWVKIPSTPGYVAGGIVNWGQQTNEKRRSMIFWNGGAGSVHKIYFSGYAANVGGTTDVSDDTWHHAVVTVSSSYLVTVYVDGVQEAQSTPTLQSYSYSGTLIGDTTTNDEEYEGLLDDVRIYNRALSASEIKRLYNLGAKAAKAGTAPASGTLSTQGGLVGHWTFDGKHMTSNVADASGAGNNGSLILGVTGNTATTTAMGVGGQAMRFDGTDDYINLGSPSSLDLSPGNAFTLSAWVNPASNPDGAGIITEAYNVAGGLGLNVQYELGFDMDSGSAGGKLSGGFYNGGWYTAYDTVRISNNTWTHAVITWNGSVLELYKNGVSVDTTVVASSLPTTTIGPSLIGRRHDDAGLNDFFPGTIDDARIYNRALSPEEVKRLYSAGATGVKAGTAPSGGTLGAGGTSGLVGHWTFDGKHMISNVADASGSGNNGMLLGQTSTTTTFGVLGQALSFDGAGDYVSLGDSYDMGTNDMTVAFWIKTTDTDFSIVSKSLYSGVPNRWAVGVNEGSGVFSIFEGSGMASPAPVAGVTDGNWHHFVAVFDRDGNLSQYLDGVYKNSANISGQSAYNMQSSFYTFIGNYNNVDGQTPHPTALRFSGALDDVRIYNRALSVEEIKRLYDLGQ